MRKIFQGREFSLWDICANKSFQLKDMKTASTSTEDKGYQCIFYSKYKRVAEKSSLPSNQLSPFSSPAAMKTIYNFVFSRDGITYVTPAFA